AILLPNKENVRMKIRCKTSCFQSSRLRRFDEGKVYDIDQKDMKQLHDDDIAKYFTTEDGKDLVMKATTSTATTTAKKDK
ncbi:hypothetical protein, partial [Sphaerochaeta sp.]|uniref:hypothetical protein n=1 Tax=Sphaerochaeta sp. TaxID=1972642 RepID=UPI003D13A4FB